MTKFFDSFKLDPDLYVQPGQEWLLEYRPTIPKGSVLWDEPTKTLRVWNGSEWLDAGHSPRPQTPML